jgi:hypothetical protein
MWCARGAASDADTGKDLAREIREYYIRDFSHWKDHDAYQIEADICWADDRGIPAKNPPKALISWLLGLNSEVDGWLSRINKIKINIEKL